MSLHIVKCPFVFIHSYSFFPRPRTDYTMCRPSNSLLNSTFASKVAVSFTMCLLIYHCNWDHSFVFLSSVVRLATPMRPFSFRIVCRFANDSVPLAIVKCLYTCQEDLPWLNRSRKHISNTNLWMKMTPNPLELLAWWICRGSLNPKLISKLLCMLKGKTCVSKKLHLQSVMRKTNTTLDVFRVKL